MEIKEQEKIISKIKDIKDLNNSKENAEITNSINKSEVQRLYEINDRMLELVEKSLKNEKVPSKEVLDTIQTSLIITATLPWSKYNI